MRGKEDNKRENKFLSDSEEIFQTIFKEATLEIKREKMEKKQSPYVASAPPRGRWQEQCSLPGTETKILKSSATVLRKREKVKAALPDNAATVKKNSQISAGKTG